jgi:hypothetical protein
MEDVAAFVRQYTRDSQSRIRYAGSIDPLGPKMVHDRDFLREDDPNLPLRLDVISHLFGPSLLARQATVGDELLEDLFVAHWEFAVGHDCAGHGELALEVLRRQLYGTFVIAYTLPLGMDQGVPLLEAVSRSKASGKSPVPGLLLALEAQLEKETRQRAKKHLQIWRGWWERYGE